MSTILERWSTSAEQLTAVVDENPSLRGMLMGYVAESKLHDLLSKCPDASSIRKDDDHDRRRKGDRVVAYKGRDIRIEAKSLQTNSIRRHEDGSITAAVQCDASDRRSVTLPDGSKLQTTCLLTGEFDLLAVNLFEFHQRWEFAFALNADLPRSTWKKYKKRQRQFLLATLIPVHWPLQPPFVSDPFALLERLLGEPGCS